MSKIKEKDHFLRQNIKRPYVRMVRGKGIYLYDSKGRRYYDGASGGVGAVNIGHGVREIAEVMKKQAQTLCHAHISLFENQPVIDFANFIIEELAQKGMEKVYFVSTGTEATELGVKMARTYHLNRGKVSKFKIISRWSGYHGSSLSALSYGGRTSRRFRYHPYYFPVHFIPPAYCYRCPYNKEYGKCCLECAYALEDAIKRENPDTVSAFIAEPMVNTMGSLPAPPEYFKIIRKICDKYDVVMLIDEVITGFGRTGKRFGMEHWETVPDITACGKGIAGGYAPLGAAIVHRRIWEGLKKEPTGNTIEGYTYGGNPFSCATGLAVQQYIKKHNLVNQSAKMGGYMLNQLKKAIVEFPIAGDIRGKGLFMAIEFVKDRETKETFPPELNLAGKIFDRLLNKGMVTCPVHGDSDGVSGDSIIIKPAFIVTHSQIDTMIDIVKDVIKETEGGLR